MTVDLTTEPLGVGRKRQAGCSSRMTGRATARSQETMLRAVPCRHVREQYADRIQRRFAVAIAPDSNRESVSMGTGLHLHSQSAVLRRCPTLEPPPLTDIVQARALALLGDSITTDHISPARLDQEGQPPPAST
jgi:aconitate hydratase